jgi:hypothetical protein
MLPLRMAFCPKCKAFFWICRRCDRGQRYCSKECSVAARKASRKRARQRYRNSERGRAKHRRAERRRRRRRLSPNLVRNIASVGDHGSRSDPNCGTSQVRPGSDEPKPNGRTEAKSHENKALDDSGEKKRNIYHCAWCGRAGSGINLAATRGWWPRRGY